MTERIQNGILSNKLIFLGDLLALYIAQIMAIYIRPAYVRSAIDPNPTYTLLAILTIAFLAIFFGKKYKYFGERGYLIELGKVIKFVLQIAAFTIMIMFSFKISESYSRIYLFSWFLFATVIMYIFRLSNRYLRNTYNIGIIKRIALLICDDVNTPHIQSIKNYYYINAVHSTHNQNIPNAQALSSLAEAVQYATNNVVDEVFIIDVDFSKEVQDTINTLTDMGISVHYNLNKSFQALSHVQMHRIAGGEYITMGINIIGEKDIILKRFFDIVLSIIGIVLSLPIFLIVAPIIKFTDGGSIFFAQKRVGRNGRIFNMYKIRSMYMDAEERKAALMSQNEMQGLMFKIKDDPRITPIGKFIRKTSIDELPQFWNVLKGEMSLIGTRPPTVDEYNKYEPWHKARLAIKPGITGLWQVSGRSDINNFDEVVQLDKEYIKKWSLLLDIKIILKTFAVVLGKKGSR